MTNPEDLARQRWKPVAKALDRRDRVRQQYEEAQARAAELRARLPEAERSDREIRARALLDGKTAPAEGEKEKVEAEFEAITTQIDNLNGAADLVERELLELRQSNRDGWHKTQARAVAAAEKAVQDATDAVERVAAVLADEQALLT